MILKSERIRSISRLALGSLSIITILGLSGCATTEIELPTSMAIRRGTVSNLDAVKVRVSLANRAVYVYDGEEPRFIATIAIGTRENPTPIGNFRAFNKFAKKRSGSYGYFVRGDQIIPGKRSAMPSGYRYVGYPMPYWVEFKSGYGFHAGAVWPSPRSHGCLRIHKSVAGDFFRMVKEGVPIHIANSLPEDSTIGKNIPRPTDYDHADSPPAVRITDAPFSCAPNVYF